MWPRYRHISSSARAPEAIHSNESANFDGERSGSVEQMTAAMWRDSLVHSGEFIRMNLLLLDGRQS